MFTTPTAIRAIKKMDPNGDEIKKYKLNNFKYLFLAGERADPETIKWSIDQLKVPVIDHWWQTETGWSIAGNFPEFGIFDIKYGSTGKAAPGYKIEVLDEDGNLLKKENIGILPSRKISKKKILKNAEIPIVQALLKEFGYKIQVTENMDLQTILVLNAFQSHYVQDRMKNFLYDSSIIPILRDLISQKNRCLTKKN